MKRIIILTSFFLLACDLGAQDLITRTDGGQIYCRILKVDSATITYKTPQVRDEQIINRSLVQSYYQSASAARPAESVKQKKEGDPDVFLLKFRIGSAKPIGDFASMDVNSEKSGLALSGLAGDVTAIIKLHPVIGLSLAYKLQNNPFNVDLICDELRSLAPTATFTGESEDWKIRGIFAGLHLCLPARQPEGFWITADVAGGFPRFYYPHISIVGNPSGTPVTVTQSASEVSTPAISAGLGIRYNLTRSVALDLNVDYCSSKPRFRVTTSNNLGYYETNSYEQTVRTVNICAGLAFCFQKGK